MENETTQPQGETLEEALARIKGEIEGEYKGRFEIWKATELAELETQQDTKIQQLVNDYFEKWKEKQKPPTPEDLQKLLNQEYISFNLKLVTEDGDREFVIRELPQAVEKKFYRTFKTQLQKHAPELGALAQKSMDKNFEERIMAFLETFDGAFDMLAETVVLCLNPFNKEEGVGAKWVQENISSQRQWNIVRAQIEVNRLRDFFLQLSLSGQQAASLTTPLNYQQLQQLARS